MTWLQNVVKVARPQHGLLGEEVIAYRSVDLSRAEEAIRQGFPNNQYFTTDEDRAVFYANFTGGHYPGAIFECTLDSSSLVADMNDATESESTQSYEDLKGATWDMLNNLQSAGIDLEMHQLEQYVGGTIGADIGGYYEQYNDAPSLWMFVAQETSLPVEQIREALPSGNYGEIHVDNRGVLGWTEVHSGQMTHGKSIPPEMIHRVYLHTELADMVGMKYNTHPNGTPEGGMQNYVNPIPYQAAEFVETLDIQISLAEEDRLDEDHIDELKSLRLSLFEDDDAIIGGNIYRKLYADEPLMRSDFEAPAGGFVPFELPQNRMAAIMAIRKGM